MKRLIIILTLLIACVTHVAAQNKSCFKVYDAATKQEVKTFCVGQKIKVVNCIPVPPNTIQYYDYDSSNGVTFGTTDTVNTHQYNTAGKIRISFVPVYQNQVGSDSVSQVFEIKPSPAPTLTLTACANNKINIRITDTNYDYYRVNFGDGVERRVMPQKDTVYQYNNSLPPLITLQGKYRNALCIGTRIFNITPLPVATTPLLENIKIDNNGNTGNFTFSKAQKDYIYVIERENGAGFTVIDSIKYPTSSNITYQLKNISPNNSECFRVRVTDKCNSNSLPVSNIICTLPLTTTVNNEKIALTWPAYPKAVNAFEILKDGQPYKRLPPSATSFEDTEVDCGKRYCYEVTAIISQQSTNITSASNESCQTGISNSTPAPGYLSSTFTPGNTITLLFKAPDTEIAREITFQKTDNNTASTISVTDQTTATDVFTGKTSCYQAVYQNQCNQNSAASNTTCPVILEGSMAGNNQVNLKWSEYIGFADGVQQYNLERLDVAGNILGTTIVTGNSFNDNIPEGEQVLSYRIKAISNNTNEESYSNTILLNQESRLQIPTAFTPNGDNLNDQFEVKGKFIKEFRLVIYNRWGQAVFQSNSQQNGWNGMINGKEAPIGVYTYTVTATAVDGKQLSKSGTVTLLR